MPLTPFDTPPKVETDAPFDEWIRAFLEKLSTTIYELEDIVTANAPPDAFVSQLADLSDVLSAVYTDGLVLRANGFTTLMARLAHTDLTDDEIDKHRVINDVGSSNIVLFSANRILNLISGIVHNAIQIQGTPVSADAPTNEDIFRYNSTTGLWELVHIRDSYPTFEGWDGHIVDTANMTVTSDGLAAPIFTLTNAVAGGIQLLFSSGIQILPSPSSVSVVPGTDEVPRTNYIYTLESDGLLHSNITGFPEGVEHGHIAVIFVQSTASVATDGVYKLHGYTDHVHDAVNDIGHIVDINKWIRNQHATYFNGVAPLLTITPQGGADDVIFTCSAGTVFQLHDHVFPAFVGTPDIYIINDPVTPYKKVTNLNTITAYSDGVAIPNNKRFSIVLKGIINENQSDCKLMLNLPSGGYNTDIAALQDVDGFSNYTTPEELKGTSFLIARYTLHFFGGDLSLVAGGAQDLRGFLPNTVAGGIVGATTEFSDANFRIFDNADPTKILEFQASGINTGTTRTLTIPDVSGITVVSGMADAVDLGSAESLEIPNASDVSSNTTKGMLSVDSDDDTLFLGIDGSQVQITRYVNRGDPASADFGVGDLTTDGSFHDLDLSSIVPAGAIAVNLSVAVQDNVINSRILIRKNSNTNAANSIDQKTQVANITINVSGIVSCDSNRVIEYLTTNRVYTAINITVMGWFI